jgi:hypothetical protein
MIRILATTASRPESITALMVAVDQEQGDEAVRLHAEAIADFEGKRVEIVNPALVSPPRAVAIDRMGAEFALLEAQ